LASGSPQFGQSLSRKQRAVWTGSISASKSVVAIGLLVKCEITGMAKTIPVGRMRQKERGMARVAWQKLVV
jgi:hypothetical protein